MSQKNNKTDQIFIYWDDPMGSRDIVNESEREDSLIAMEGNRWKKKSKVKRVDDLYQRFQKLSQIEKHNFINLIKNQVIHG